ncbi:MAG TPA: DUF433 domain-containing protein [Rhizomicrobium sp.]
MTMSPDLEMLTPPEAAAVAGVEVRDINRMIDEHVLPESLYSNAANRRVKAGACALVRFYYDSANVLTASERRHVINHVVEEARHKRAVWTIKHWRDAKPHWTVTRPYVTLNFDRFIDQTIAGHDKLSKARQIVVEDPAILSGTPVIKGTRVPVYDVAASAEKGASLAEIREDYPSLDNDRIELAILYAKATPQRGRPKAGLLNKGKLISRKIVPRRRA